MFERIKNILKYGEDLQQQTEVHQPEPVVKKDIFAENTYGQEVQIRLIKRAIHASKPTPILLTGQPGLNKTGLARCIEQTCPEKTIWMNGKRLTEAGIHADIKKRVDRQQKELIVVVDEIEKAHRGVTDTFLPIIEEGRLTQTIKTDPYDIRGLKVTLVATCNDFKKFKRDQPALLDRLMVIEIQKPTVEEFLAICQFRLTKEGVSTEVALYIGSEIHKVFGPDMREAVRVSRMAKTPQDVDEVIADLKAVGVQ